LYPAPPTREPDGDIVVSAGPLVYAVLTGDGRTVRVRP
jgi:hypothetical protein